MKAEVVTLLETLYKDIAKNKQVCDAGEVDTGKKLLVLRSGNMSFFQQCIKDIKQSNSIEELLVIGKAGDEVGIEQVWDKKYTLIPIEGNYSVERLMPHIELIKEYNADCNVYLAYGENDQQTLNIYEMMSFMAGSNVYEYLLSTYWNRMCDMKKYYRAMNLIVTLIEWYYGEKYE